MEIKYASIAMECNQMNVLGLGFRKSATLKSFENALTKTNFKMQLDAVAIPIDKFNHPFFILFAKEIGVTILKISKTLIRHQQTPTQSKIVQYFVLNPQF